MNYASDDEDKNLPEINKLIYMIFGPGSVNPVNDKLAYTKSDNSFVISFIHRKNIDEPFDFNIFVPRLYRSSRLTNGFQKGITHIIIDNKRYKLTKIYHRNEDEPKSIKLELLA